MLADVTGRSHVPREKEEAATEIEESAQTIVTHDAEGTNQKSKGRQTSGH